MIFHDRMKKITKNGWEWQIHKILAAQFPCNLQYSTWVMPELLDFDSHDLASKYFL